jgi:hypothetical protein
MNGEKRLKLIVIKEGGDVVFQSTVAVFNHHSGHSRGIG